jgi:plastocyanin
MGCQHGETNNSNTPPMDSQQTIEDATAAVADSSNATPKHGEHTFIVEINKMKFMPDQLTVRKGDTVVWVNNDLTNHCVSEQSKAWTSGTLVPGAYWMKVMNKDADYYCAIHVVMKGQVHVE